MPRPIKNVFISGYDAGRLYDRYELAYVNSGIYPVYFVSVVDGHVSTLDDATYLSNDYWKRLDDNSYRFTDVWTPTYQTSMALDSKPRSVTFGDGYEQRSDASIFGNRATYEIAFKNIDNRELKSLVAYFEERAGADYFYMDVNPFVTGRKIIGKTWKHTYLADNLNDFSVSAFEAVTDE